MDKNFKRANLLIENYKLGDDLKAKILKNEWICIDDEIPVCRFRGTFIEGIENNKLKIVVWQRNVARIRRMDVSLPTIITMILNKDKIIEKVELDRSFKGSKGLFCSYKYLHKNLVDKIVGEKLDQMFLKKIKVENMHCFHITEILAGLYSYFNTIEGVQIFQTGDTFFDEEVTDSHVVDGSLIACGKQYRKGKKPFYYSILMKDIFNNISFGKDGYLNIKDKVEVSFYINDVFTFKEILYPNSNEFIYSNLSKLAIKFIYELKKFLGFDKRYKMLNTNLIPAAYIGLLVQALSVRMYQNSYDYTMHVLTTIQRKNNTPMCIGSIENVEEALNYFPKFSIEEIL